MDVVEGIDALRARARAGLRRRRRLRRPASRPRLPARPPRRRGVGARRPADRHHVRPPSRRGPDAGRAPPLLLDPEERLERLEAAGRRRSPSSSTSTRRCAQTPYDAFVERIRARVALTGFLMTPDAAFGFERRGTPRDPGRARGARRLRRRRRAAVHARRPARSAAPTIRDRDRARRPRRRVAAARPAGHDHGLRSATAVDGRDPARVRLPVALPPDGEYAVPRGRRAACPADQRRRRLPARAGPRTARHGRARSGPDRSLSRRRGSRGPRRGSSRRPPAWSTRSLRLPGRFAGRVVSLATGLTAIVPRGVRFRRRAWQRPPRALPTNQCRDLRQDRHQAPGSHSGSATPRSWFS